MRIRKLLALVLAVIMVFASASAIFAGEEPDNDIVIIHTNDVHCGYMGGSGDDTWGKYERLAAIAKTADLLVDNGDSIQGDVIGTLSKGEYIIDIMNNVGYDVAGIGNHEFDYGFARFQELAGKADFPYVCCNLVDLKTGEPVFDAYKVFEVKGKKVAFVGVATPETLVKSTPTYFQDTEGNWIYGFCQGNNGQDLYDAVQSAVTAAKAEADYVILVGHLGIDDESKPWTMPEVIAHVSGIDVVIDGHSHSEYSELTSYTDKDGNAVPAQQTGTKLANAGKITLKADGSVAMELIPITKESAVDAETKTFVEGVTAKFDVLQKTVVAKTEVALRVNDENGKRIVRNNETNLGDLCADAYRVLLGADCAFVNGGGIRADIPVGDITYGQIVSVHPFGNSACLVEVTGQQILDALELGAKSYPGEAGGFLQVSGITYTIDEGIESHVVLDSANMFVKVDGARRVKDVKIGGVAIDPAKTYKLASHNYMLKSAGDGYAMFGKNKVTVIKDEVLIDNQVLINYIVDELDGVVGQDYAKPQGRITIVDSSKSPDTGMSIALYAIAAVSALAAGYSIKKSKKED